jgi:hypothetical protein
VKAARSRRNIIGGAVSRVIYSVFALVLGVLHAVDIGPSLRAARGEGALGSFVLEWEQCARYNFCSWYGGFLADDAAYSLTETVMEDNPWIYPAQTVRAVRPAGSDKVYLAEGSGHWRWAIGVTAAGAIGFMALAWWFMFRDLPALRGLQRTSHPLAAPPRPKDRLRPRTPKAGRGRRRSGRGRWRSGRR